jgi:hypothetical protein
MIRRGQTASDIRVLFSEGISRQETALNCVQPVCRASPWKQPCKQEIRCGMTLAALYHMDCEVLIKTQ